ncbi:MAG: DUF692 family protein [Anaerolineae bacterium]|nr:DUF692 family protein [Anaerolineae bacterium]
MKFAINYSPESLRLYDKGQIHFDLVKLPAWEDAIKAVKKEFACYVHFPLKVGRGKGVIDNETKEPVKWKKIEKMMRQTGTEFVNLHLSLPSKHHPEIPKNSLSTVHFDQVLEKAGKDVQEAVKHFGAEKVIVENEHDGKGRNLRLNTHPEIYHRLMAETGCGFLLDVSHARIAARSLGVDEKEYLQSLPVQHIKEIHLTGIEWFGESHIERARTGGLTEKWISRISETWMDHLPMTSEDWPMVEWVLASIRSGEWSHPWVIALEYGGLGGFFGTFTDEDVLIEQIPKLYSLIHTI